jgi:hypothetical protein
VHVENTADVVASAYRHPHYGTTVVLINRGVATQIALDAALSGPATVYTSSAFSLWKRSTSSPDQDGQLRVNMPGQSIVTLQMAQPARK